RCATRTVPLEIDEVRLSRGRRNSGGKRLRNRAVARAAVSQVAGEPFACERVSDAAADRREQHVRISKCVDQSGRIWLEQRVQPRGRRAQIAQRDLRDELSRRNSQLFVEPPEIQREETRPRRSLGFELGL